MLHCFLDSVLVMRCNHSSTTKNPITRLTSHVFLFFDKTHQMLFLVSIPLYHLNRDFNPKGRSLKFVCLHLPIELKIKIAMFDHNISNFCLLILRCRGSCRFTLTFVRVIGRRVRFHVKMWGGQSLRKVGHVVPVFGSTRTETSWIVIWPFCPCRLCASTLFSLALYTIRVDDFSQNVDRTRWFSSGHSCLFPFL